MGFRPVSYSLVIFYSMCICGTACVVIDLLVRTQASIPAPTPAPTRGEPIPAYRFLWRHYSSTDFRHRLQGHRDPHRNTALQTNSNVISFKTNSRDPLRHRVAPTHGSILFTMILWLASVVRCFLRALKFRTPDLVGSGGPGKPSKMRGGMESPSFERLARVPRTGQT